uniref:Uncharacterized protein n=1 Tax=Amphimedon queenslandica TaxID=400682 RepID=A0A1X7VTY5_AMPQE
MDENQVKEIRTCKLIESELSSRKKPKGVYKKYGSSLVLYESDPASVLKENHNKLAKLMEKDKN